MKIYIAAPLFNEMEITRNEHISDLLEKIGFKTYLPQRDGGLFHELKKQGYPQSEIKKQIFNCDYHAIYNCEIVLCLLDGRTLDEGMCIELGIGYALGKHCLGYKTDVRTQDRFGNNIMLEGVLHAIFGEEENLVRYLKTYKPQCSLGVEADFHSNIH